MSELTDSIVVYNVARDPERRVFDLTGLKGSSTIDTGYFYCPYRPGMTDEEKDEMMLREWYDSYHNVKIPTDIQRMIMDNVKNTKIAGQRFYYERQG
jgi:hypothetical protein